MATFSDPNLTAIPSDFTATINWGDGTTSVGTVVAKPGIGFAVQGYHIYNTTTGVFKASITVRDIDGSTANVATNVYVSRFIAKHKRTVKKRR